MGLGIDMLSELARVRRVPCPADRKVCMPAKKELMRDFETHSAWLCPLQLEAPPVDAARLEQQHSPEGREESGLVESDGCTAVESHICQNRADMGHPAFVADRAVRNPG